MTKIILTLGDGGECMAQIAIGNKMAGIAYGHSGLEGQGIFLDKVQMSNETSTMVGEVLSDFGIALTDSPSTLKTTSTTGAPEPAETFY